MYGDPADVRALAQRVLAWADEVRLVAGRTEGADGVEWHSTAADRFRGTLAEQAGAVAARADALDDLAAALLAHATAVEERLAQIAAAERFVRAQVSQARESVSGLVGTMKGWADDATDWATDAARAGADRVLDVADELPRPGSLDWLDLADHLS